MPPLRVRTGIHQTCTGGLPCVEGVRTDRMKPVTASIYRGNRDGSPQSVIGKVPIPLEGGGEGDAVEVVSPPIVA